MILLQLLKINFSLIDKGFYYFGVIKCMLDIPSLLITSYFMTYSYSTCSYIAHINVRDCSWYQTKVF